MRLLATIVAAVFIMTALPAAAVPPPREPTPDWTAVELKANQGDAEAQVRMGDKAAADDKAAALAWYEKADAQGHAEAHRKMEALRANRDLFVAMKAAAGTGDLKARYDYNIALVSQINGWGELYNLDRFRDLAQAGYAPAQADMGRYFISVYRAPANIGVPPQDRIDSLPKAIFWLEKAAAQDDGAAMLALAVAYAIESPLRDIDRMEDWMVKVAYRPLPPRAYGSLDNKDPDKLAADYAFSALEALCPYYVGVPFHGTLVYQIGDFPSVQSPPDYAKARTCYRHQMAFYQADESGYKLAFLLEHSLGGGRDLTEAATLYRGVAEGESVTDLVKPDAMAHLGLIHAELGQTEEAGFWFHLLSLYAPYGNPAMRGQSPSLFPDVFLEPELMMRADAVSQRVTAALTRRQRLAISLRIKTWLDAHPYDHPEPILD